MIALTRLNGSPLFVNGDLIKWAEAAPDTMLTLVSGEKVVVRESCTEVVERITAHRVALLAEVVRYFSDADGLLRAATAASLSRLPSEPIAPQGPPGAGRTRRREVEEDPGDSQTG